MDHSSSLRRRLCVKSCARKRDNIEEEIRKFYFVTFLIHCGKQNCSTSYGTIIKTNRLPPYFFTHLYTPLFPDMRTCSSTNRRIAEDRLPCSRALSISPTTFDSVAWWACAISFSPLQNASSRLMLVLCPSMTMERLTICDFMSPRFSQAVDSVKFRADQYL